MPLIQVKVIENVFAARQKPEVVGKLTDAMVAVADEDMRQVTWVIIEDVHSGEWRIGGRPMYTEAVKALASGKS